MVLIMLLLLLILLSCSTVESTSWSAGESIPLHKLHNISILLLLVKNALPQMSKPGQSFDFCAKLPDRVVQNVLLAFVLNNTLASLVNSTRLPLSNRSLLSTFVAKALAYIVST